MKKFFYLSTCDTCKKIMKELDLSDFELQDIKSNPLTESQLNELKELTCNFDSLFSRRAQLYKKLGLKDKNLADEDLKNYLLEHYTFLKRPVLVYNSEIFIGNSKKNIELLKEKFGK